MEEKIDDDSYDGRQIVEENLLEHVRLQQQPRNVEHEQHQQQKLHDLELHRQQLQIQHLQQQKQQQHIRQSSYAIETSKVGCF
jgi:hypothetical protein